MNELLARCQLAVRRSEAEAFAPEDVSTRSMRSPSFTAAKRSGIGTVIALMLPYFVALAVVWTAYVLGLPWGI